MKALLKKLRLILLSIPFLFVSCEQNNPLLKELDEVLGHREEYDLRFHEHVTVLKTVLAEQDEDLARYNMNKRIAVAYQAHNFDSTMLYLNRNRELAVRIGDDARLVETMLMMMKEYSSAGYYIEAIDIMNSLDETAVPDNVRLDYYMATQTLVGEMIAYSNPDRQSRAAKVAVRDRCREILLERLEEGSYDWCEVKYEVARGKNDKEAAMEYAKKMVEISEPGSRAYARACFFCQIYLPGSSDEKMDWLIKSSIADIKCSTKDYAALNELAQYLFNHGDLERAFRYTADYCLNDALYFNGKLRPWQISRFFPQLEQAYQEKSLKQSKTMTGMLVLLSVISLIVIFMLFLMYRRQQILDALRRKLEESYMQIDEQNSSLKDANSRLMALNAEMKEADKVKQEYIALFLEILSENINKTRQYKNHVLKSIRQGNARQLVAEIENLPPIDDDILEFYKMFDQTFVNLYPNFVSEFNALLVDGEAIVPKDDDILSPELRIFALIKLGITDSRKIASLLHYSANTIYNYRAKIKNKAKGSRSEFEASVRNLN